MQGLRLAGAQQLAEKLIARRYFSRAARGGRVAATVVPAAACQSSPHLPPHHDHRESPAAEGSGGQLLQLHQALLGGDGAHVVQPEMVRWSVINMGIRGKAQQQSRPVQSAIQSWPRLFISGWVGSRRPASSCPDKPSTCGPFKRPSLVQQLVGELDAGRVLGVQPLERGGQLGDLEGRSRWG